MRRELVLARAPFCVLGVLSQAQHRGRGVERGGEALDFAAKRVELFERARGDVRGFRADAIVLQRLQLRLRLVAREHRGLDHRVRVRHPLGDFGERRFQRVGARVRLRRRRRLALVLHRGGGERRLQRGAQPRDLLFERVLSRGGGRREVEVFGGGARGDRVARRRERAVERLSKPRHLPRERRLALGRLRDSLVAREDRGVEVSLELFLPRGAGGVFLRRRAGGFAKRRVQLGDFILEAFLSLAARDGRERGERGVVRRRERRLR